MEKMTLRQNEIKRESGRIRKRESEYGREAMRERKLEKEREM